MKKQLEETSLVDIKKLGEQSAFGLLQSQAKLRQLTFLFPFGDKDFLSLVQRAEIKWLLASIVFEAEDPSDASERLALVNSLLKSGASVSDEDLSLIE